MKKTVFLMTLLLALFIFTVPAWAGWDTAEVQALPGLYSLNDFNFSSNGGELWVAYTDNSSRQFVAHTTPKIPPQQTVSWIVSPPWPGGTEQINKVVVAGTGVWAFGNSGTICYYDGNAWGAVMTPFGFGASSSIKDAVIAPNGSIWAGSYSGQTARWDSGSGTWVLMGKPFAGQTYPQVLAMAAATDGAVWAAGPKSLVARWDGANWTTIAWPYTDYVTALAASPDGTLWAGDTTGHVMQWTGASWVDRGQMPYKVTTLAVKPDLTVWAFTSPQLPGQQPAMYRWKNGVWVVAFSYGVSRVDSLKVSLSGELWGIYDKQTPARWVPKVSGVVTDTAGKPLQNAYVYYGSSTWSWYGFYTDSSGYYEFFAPNGTYAGTVSHPGYTPISDNITTDDLDIPNHNFVLSPATVASLTVAPSTAAVQPGQTASFTATATLTDNSTKDVTALADWSVSDPSVASVAYGTVTGLSPGTTTVMAVYEGVAGSAAVTVLPPVLSYMQITPPSATVPVGGQQQFTVTGYYYGGSTADLTHEVTWQSLDPPIATVVNGLATGVAPGSTVISAVYSGQVASANITVLAPPQVTSLTVTPTPGYWYSLNVGETKNLIATAFYSDGTLKDVTNDAAWTVGDPSVASVVYGAVTGLKSGSTVATATYGGFSGQWYFAVQAPYQPPQPSPVVLNNLTVQPNAVTVNVGQTARFTATAWYSDGTQRDVTHDAAWSVSDPAVASVICGLATGLTPGQTVVSSTYAGLTATANLTVTAPPPPPLPPELVITPSTATVSVGGTQQFTATYYPNGQGAGNGEDVTGRCSWSVQDNSIASVGANTGLATGLAAGQTAVQAAYGGLTATANLTVTTPVQRQITLTGTARLTVVDNTPPPAPAPTPSPPSGAAPQQVPVLVKVEVTPKTLDLLVGETGQLKATAYYNDDTVQDVTAVAAWSSDNNAVATVNSGLVTGVASGKANISATYAGLSDSAAVTVRELTGTVFGYVKDKNGRPIAGAKVELHSAPQITFTNSEGYYEFRDVPLGRHTVLIADARLEQVQRIDVVLDPSGQHVVQEGKTSADVQLALFDREKRVDFVVVPKAAAAPEKEKPSQPQAAEAPAPQAQPEPQPAPGAIPQAHPAPEPVPVPGAAPQPSPEPAPKPLPEPAPAPQNTPQPAPQPTPKPQPAPAERLPWWPVLLLLPPLVLLRAVAVSAGPDPENPEGALVKRGSFGLFRVRVKVHVVDWTGNERIDVVYLARKDRYRIASASRVAVKTPGWLNLARKKKFANPAA